MDGPARQLRSAHGLQQQQAGSQSEPVDLTQHLAISGSDGVTRPFARGLGGKVAGQPGWRVSYVTKPTSDGSGAPVAVKGAFYLHVAITGAGYPPDTGVPEPTTRRISPADTKIVREVVLDGVFEGIYTAYVGLSAKKPFRVFRLSNPARVVIDVRHA